MGDSFLTESEQQLLNDLLFKLEQGGPSNNPTVGFRESMRSSDPQCAAQCNFFAPEANYIGFYKFSMDLFRLNYFLIPVESCNLFEPTLA
jgi:hypothetical protein